MERGAWGILDLLQEDLALGAIDASLGVEQNRSIRRLLGAASLLTATAETALRVT